MYFFRHISITSNVNFTVDKVHLFLSLEFRQNVADFVSFTPVGRRIPIKKMRCV